MTNAATTAMSGKSNSRIRVFISKLIEDEPRAQTRRHHGSQSPHSVTEAKRVTEHNTGEMDAAEKYHALREGVKAEAVFL